MNFHELMVAAGKLIGFDNLEPDEDGVCRLHADEMSITVQDMKEDDSIIFSTIVGEVPSSRMGDTALFKSLAEANFMFKQTLGATVSCEPGTNNIWLIRCDRAYDWSPEEVVYMIERFVDAVFNIRTILSGGSVAEERSEPPSEKMDSAFMQV